MWQLANSEKLGHFLLAVPIVVLMYILHTYNDATIGRVLAAGLVLFTVIAYGSSLKTINYDINYYGKDAFVNANSVLRQYNYLSAHQLDKVTLVLRSVTVLVLVQALAFELWWIPIGVYLFVLTRALGMRALPPFALILGESGARANDLVIQALKSVRPLSVRELLSIKPSLRGDDLQRGHTTVRLMNDLLNWEALVDVYAEFAKVIIVDARSITQYLRDELGLLNRRSLWYKTIIHADENSKAGEEVAALLRGYGAPTTIICDSISNVVECLGEIARDKMKMPSPDRPAWSMCRRG